MKVLSALAAVAMLPTLLTSAPAQAADQHNNGHHQAVWGQRAVESYQALQTHLFLGEDGHGLYLEKYPVQAGDNAYSYLWPMREAAAAAVSLQGMAKTEGRHGIYRTAARERLDAIESYYNVRDNGRAGYESYVPAPLGGGGDVYYDDNAVVGLTQFNQFQATGKDIYLDRARHSFDIVQRGWDDDPAKECPGGMDWIDTASNTVRGANVTGLAAELAAHLYEQTGEHYYLDWATKLYDWNNECLKQSDGLYWNSRSDDGSINKTLWTYNSGAMIGTATILYRATGNPEFLTEAKEAAEGSLAYWTVGNRLQQQPAIFNSIYFQNLLLLDSVSPNPQYRQVMETYAQRTWENNRDPETGLFRFQPSGGGDYDAAAPAHTLHQSAMIQIFASLAWDREDYWRIA